MQLGNELKEKRRPGSPWLLTFLRSHWGTIRHGVATLAAGVAFLFLLSFAGEEPQASFGDADPLAETSDYTAGAAPHTPEDLGAPDRMELEPGWAAVPPMDPTADSVIEAPPPEPEWREYTVAKNDTMGEILRKISDDEEAVGYLIGKDLKSYRRLRPGKSIRYKVGASGELVELQYKTSADYYMHFRRTGEGMEVTEDAPVLSETEVRKNATVSTSLYEAMDRANVGGSAIDGLITALETHIDFHRDLRKGDRFEMVYDEQRDADGELIGTTRPKAFYASNRGREIVGVYFPEAGGYYTPDGESLQRAFLRSPVKFSRISSKFSLRRLHPVLKQWRAHRGVDYAAPRGTPVRASGDGVVDFVGKKGGYGNVIFLKHYKIYTTVYGHLHRFAKGLRKGQRVSQGEVIGYVGSTGLSTGPHLHYEFRVRGKHRDPLSEAVPVQLPPLEGADLEQFKGYAAPLLAQLESHKPEKVALQE